MYVRGNDEKFRLIVNMLETTSQRRFFAPANASQPLLGGAFGVGANPTLKTFFIGNRHEDQGVVRGVTIPELPWHRHVALIRIAMPRVTELDLPCHRYVSQNQYCHVTDAGHRIIIIM